MLLVAIKHSDTLNVIAMHHAMMEAAEAVSWQDNKPNLLLSHFSSFHSTFSCLLSSSSWRFQAAVHNTSPVSLRSLCHRSAQPPVRTVSCFLSIHLAVCVLRLHEIELRTPLHAALTD
ncbi:uncharacterized protein MYCFIDRAFT_169397 [Pseudocercospora fijiensis CIRAD86]|uniref:Uncharacterized protein n=1 Tax=Pseudocercospora fijiensis (strain CIRAD86) TaxID=383855 RepID=N1Q7I3_PSEFD|nr:uncharacterized protein MYCFIDRAFT_169397 [Pseudocercospora fijiensis CIRAD86]EME87601.1 hypothetical protein MYCFIDRAFT_169397 [Pseudocercospora fijiensis CIRAD86]